MAAAEGGELRQQVRQRNTRVVEGGDGGVLVVAGLGRFVVGGEAGGAMAEDALVVDAVAEDLLHRPRVRGVGDPLSNSAASASGRPPSRADSSVGWAAIAGRTSGSGTRPMYGS